MRFTEVRRPSNARRAGWLLACAAAMLGVFTARVEAQRPTHTHPPPASTSDSAFHALQARGLLVMGVDQYTSAHRFDTLPDGGRIVLERMVEDSAGVAAIRAHLRTVAAAFARGDFSASREVHAMELPGTRVLVEGAHLIEYTVRDLPRGAELRIRTTDAAALQAIREFMTFQNLDHRTGH